MATPTALPLPTLVFVFSLVATGFGCDATTIAFEARDAAPEPAPNDANVLADAGEPRDAGSEAAADSAPDAVVPGPLAFVFAGESNSGGIALNSAATAGELNARPAVQIMNLYSGKFSFEPLKIGFNNVVDHAGLSNNVIYVPNPPNTILVHGMELGLANAVESAAFAGVTSVYLIKTGQGGSRIAEWASDGAYWKKFIERTDAAKAQLPNATRWVVWYSQGLNDAVGNVPIAAWKTATVAHLAKIKAQLPNCQILLTEFQSMPANGGYPQVNQAIREIVAADPTLTSVDTTGAGTDGANHWSYAGYRNTVVPALVAKTNR
jgi:Carbohydrate esterase, sialic acid-specific acetylesterase